MNFSQLEDPTVYSELRVDSRRSSVTERDNRARIDLPTPAYEDPIEINRPNVRQMVLSGMIIPKTFDGTGDVRAWLEDYDLVAEANKWKDEEKFNFLIVFLSGPSLIWFRRMKRDPQFNWIKFKEEIVKKNSNSCDTLMAETKIMRRKQREDETLNSYWEDKLHLIETLTPLKSAKDKMTLLVNGLKESLYSKIIYGYLARQPDSIDELYMTVKLRDDAYNFAPEKIQRRVKFDQSYDKDSEDEIPGQRVTKKQDFKIDKLIKSVESLTVNLSKDQQRRNDWNRNRRDDWNRNRNQNRPQFQQSVIQAPTQNTGRSYERRSRDLKEVTCWSCNKQGHYSNNCPEKNKNETQPKNPKRGN